MNSSYASCTRDGETGLRYYFPYYTGMLDDPEGKPTVQSIAQATLLGLIFVAVLIANVAILGWLVCYNDVRTPINLYFVNLAVADIVFALGMPAIAYVRLSRSWCLGEIFCKLLSYTEFLGGSAILWSLAFVSIERYRCATITACKSSLSVTKAILINVVIWIFAAVLSLPVAFTFEVRETSEGAITTICTLVFSRAKLASMSVCFVGIMIVSFAFLLPMALLVYNCCWLLRIILKGRHRWAVACVVQGIDPDIEGDTGRRDSDMSSIAGILISWPGRRSSGASIVTCPTRPFRAGSLSRQEEIRKRKHLRIIRLLSVTVLTVLTAWLPITLILILLLVNMYDRETSRVQNFSLSSHHFVWTLIIAQSSTALNPLLYGVCGPYGALFRGNFAGRLTNLLGRFARSKRLGDSSEASVMELRSPTEESR